MRDIPEIFLLKIKNLGIMNLEIVNEDYCIKSNCKHFNGIRCKIDWDNDKYIRMMCSEKEQTMVGNLF